MKIFRSFFVIILFSLPLFAQDTIDVDSLEYKAALQSNAQELQKLADPTTGTIKFSEFNSRRVPAYSTVCHIADMNHDGRKDLIVGTSYYLFIYFQNDTGGLGKPKIRLFMFG